MLRDLTASEPLTLEVSFLRHAQHAQHARHLAQISNAALLSGRVIPEPSYHAGGVCNARKLGER